MKHKQAILVPLFVLNLLLWGNKALSQCSYVSTSSQGVTTSIDAPCDFPILMNTGIASQDTLTYRNAVAQWNALHPTLTALSVLPQPVATSTYLEIPESIFNSFSTERKAAIQRLPYYYRLKPE